MEITFSPPTFSVLEPVIEPPVAPVIEPPVASDPVVLEPVKELPRAEAPTLSSYGLLDGKYLIKY